MSDKLYIPVLFGVLIFVIITICLTNGTSAEMGILSTESSVKSARPGEVAIFNLTISNIGNKTETIDLYISTDRQNWAKYEANNLTEMSFTLNSTEQRVAKIKVLLPNYYTASSTERAALVELNYNVSVTAVLRNTSITNSINLSVIILRVDLAIMEMTIDSKYENSTPQVGDIVIFTLTVQNYGTMEAHDARIYIWNNNLDQDILLEDSGKYFLEVDIPAQTTKKVYFRWTVHEGEWSYFRAEVNPKYSDVGRRKPPGEYSDYPIDELYHYSNNRFPKGGIGLQQPDGNTIAFKIFPDIFIQDARIVPNELVSKEIATVTLTIGNQGNADWTYIYTNWPIGENIIDITIDDGRTDSITISWNNISLGVGESVQIDFQWKTPIVFEDTNITLIIKIYPRFGKYILEQMDWDNDQIEIQILVKEKEDSLIKNKTGLSLSVVIVILIAFVIIYRRRSHRQ